MRRFLTLLFIFLTCLAYGQSNSELIKQQIDSLDKIKSKEYKKMKPNGCAFVVKVNNQEQFNRINDEISEAIDQGMKNIKVKIGRGVYHFHENHIMRMHEKAPDVSITITGKNAVITSDLNFQDEVIESPWDELIQLEELIQVVSEKQKLCFIPFENDIPQGEYRYYTKVQVTQWFSCPTYEVHHIDRKGIYFLASNLAKTKFAEREGYSINYDYLYHGTFPRFRLYDASKERQYSASRFMALSGCEYRLFRVSGLHFVGNKSGMGLLTINFCNADYISVSDCSFDSIHNTVAYVEGTDNVEFDHNVVRNIDGNALSFSRGCGKVRVTRNLFEDCDLGLHQSFCVDCGEAEYYIAENTFRDFGYGAIGVGIWYGKEKTNYSGGIIEHNDIYFTPEYFANALKHMLMDSGAIYTWTQNDIVIIRYNYIHDYIGAGDNRGVFCDDGASNLKIYGNVVLNTPNCYSIDSRAVNDLGNGFRNNENNLIADNVVDNRIRFMGYAGVNRHAVKGRNILLQRKGEQRIVSIYENLEIEQKDVEIVEFFINGNGQMLPREYKSIVRKAGRKSH